MTVAVQPFSGLVYRAHHPMWAFTPLSGEGAKKFGGRFNRPGVAALYMSLDLTTAWMEAQQGFPFKPQPMTMAAYRVENANVVDLLDPRAQACLGYHAADLACAWEDIAAQRGNPPTWQLADRLQAEGFAGILVPSYAPGSLPSSRNLVLWQWSGAVQVIDDHARLPKSQASWGEK